MFYEVFYAFWVLRGVSDEGIWLSVFCLLETFGFVFGSDFLLFVLYGGVPFVLENCPINYCIRHFFVFLWKSDYRYAENMV